MTLENKNRNFYLSAVAYINSCQLMINAYKKENLFSNLHPLSAIQIMPLYYLLSMAGELTLKTCLTSNNVPMKEILGNKDGHNLAHLIKLHEDKIGNIDYDYLKNMFSALDKGEFRYTEYYGEGAYIEPINHEKFLEFIKAMLQESQDQFLRERDNMEQVG